LSGPGIPIFIFDMFQQEKTPFEFILDLYPTISPEYVRQLLEFHHYDLVNTFSQIERIAQLQDDEDHTLVQDQQQEQQEQQQQQDNINNSYSNSYSSNNNNSNSNKIPVVCKYFLNNICTDNNCKFQHILPEGMLPAAVAPVCKYFLNEGCRIRNCPFRHSADTVVCKYWMLGTCNKGDNCLFSHRLDETLENMNNLTIYQQDTLTYVPPEPPKPKPGPPPTSASTDDFPVLGGGLSSSQFPSLTRNQPTTTSKKDRKKPKNNNNNNNRNNNITIVSTPLSNPTTTTTTTTTNNNNNNKPNITTNSNTSDLVEIYIEEQDPFPTLGGGRNKQTSKKKIVYKNDASFQLQVKQLQDKYHNVNSVTVMNEFLLCNQDIEKTSQLLTNKYGKPIPKVQKPTGIISSVGDDKQNKRTGYVDHNDNVQISWVETGVDLALLYQTHREEAIIEGRERNKCFNLAAAAFLNGDPATAKILSQKGHQHDEKMRELNHKAMELIFYERNQNYLKDGKNVIDLHGLHVLEAITILEEYLVNLPLYVIIGTGHHTTAQSARLPNKIKQYLTENNFRYSDVSDDKRGGLLKIFK